MRSFKLAVSAFVVGSVMVASAASAQAPQIQQGFALDRFDPSERGSEWFALDSLDLRGRGRLAAGVVSSWSKSPLAAYDAEGNYLSSIVEHQFIVHPGASLVLWDRLRGSVSMPIALYQTGDSTTVRGRTYESPSTAFGDLRLAADVRVIGEHGGPFTGALGIAVNLPTGSRQYYMSDGTVRFTPRASIAGDISYFTYAARVGYAYRALDDTFDRTALGSEITAGAAAGLRVAHGKLVIGPEVYGGAVTDEDSFWKRRATPIEWLFGAHYTISSVRLGAGGGSGLTRGVGAPEWRAFLDAEWVLPHDDDADKDGILDPDDACPTAPGVRTSHRETNGCPAPAVAAAPSDRDGDRIVDREDACPDRAGVTNTDPKKNGCPPDRDGDGIADSDDACPDIAGGKSPDPKKNGCPPDRDDDGVADHEDACPDVAGDKSADPTMNGCPPDRDGDGIANREDACPDAPGPADTDPKRNGCPLARIEDGQIKISDQVKFKTGSAEILRDSDATLLAIATTLKNHPEVGKLRIEGHTDSRGSAATNNRLSQQRADAVLKWLTSYGIDRKRLEAKGFGFTRPLETNETEEGRQNNRRVEFHLTGGSEAPRP